MKLCVPIIGIGCSGTSAVAAMVEKADVQIIGDHHEREPFHPKGFALKEDVCWYGAFRDTRKTARNKNRILQIVEKHETDRWGWKNTLTAGALHWMMPLLVKRDNRVRVVAVQRRLDKSIRGRMTGGCPPGVEFLKSEAEVWAIRASFELFKCLYKIELYEFGSVHIVQYERLLENPSDEAAKLLRFIKLAEGADLEETIASMVSVIRK